MSRGLQGCVGTDNDAVQRGDLEEGIGSCCLLDRRWLERCRVEFRVGALKVSVHPPANYYGAVILASETFRPQLSLSRSSYKAFRRSLIHS